MVNVILLMVFHFGEAILFTEGGAWGKRQE
jgi:hypothetical protein